MSEIKVLTDDVDIWGEKIMFDPTRPNPDEDETDCQIDEDGPDSETEIRSHLDAVYGSRYR